MYIIPRRTRVMRVPFPKGEVVDRFLHEIDQDEENTGIRQGKKLRGYVDEKGFHITLNVKEPGKYLPDVHGKISEGKTGSSIFLDYQLRPKTRRLLAIWLILAGCLSVFFILGYNRWLYGIITFSLGMVQYILTAENFRLQVQRTHRVLNKIMAEERNMENRD